MLKHSGLVALSSSLLLLMFHLAILSVAEVGKVASLVD
jgi:hypothetical protein